MKKFFYFAVRRTKSVTDSTGRSRNEQVLVYGTKVFLSAEECDNAYRNWRIAHTNELCGVFGYAKELIIDPITHECKGYK